MIGFDLETNAVKIWRMVHYEMPSDWIRYDFNAIALMLTNAKAAVLSLTAIPFQRSWADELQTIQLKREVAGTSRIEGADFTEKELEAAMKDTPDELHTRSQRQAAAASKTYRWIAKLPSDMPINTELICEIHRRLVTGADDDHCPPGRLRQRDHNVNFGIPRHRGAEGGEECLQAFQSLCQAIQKEFKTHDPLIQALALHYHFAAMHPFLDGNGRTARSLEALCLQRTGLKDSLFIAMSNYYYEEKNAYLTALSEVRANGHDLTPFLLFGLRGIELQCRRLLKEIQTNIRKALFRNLMFDLFKRLRTPRKRVMAERHLEILKALLESDSMMFEDLFKKLDFHYRPLGRPSKAFIRDLNYLIRLEAIGFEKVEPTSYRFWVRLEWPTEVTETEFFAKVKAMPKAKTHTFLG
jgi:Fic family protein